MSWTPQTDPLTANAAGVPTMCHQPKPKSYQQFMSDLTPWQQLAFTNAMAQAPSTPDSFIVRVKENIKSDHKIQEEVLPTLDVVKSPKALNFLKKILKRNENNMDVFLDYEEYGFESVAKDDLTIGVCKKDQDFIDVASIEFHRLTKKYLMANKPIPQSESEHCHNLSIEFAFDKYPDEKKDAAFLKCQDDYNQIVGFMQEYVAAHNRNYYLRKNFSNALSAYVVLLWRARYAATALGMHFDELDFQVFLKNFSA